MVNYNPKEWFGFIFKLHKADTFRKLFPLFICMCVYSLLIALLEREVLHLSENNNLRNLPVMHGLLGFAISMLLVFRTNTAYDRWWEGRRLWGSLVNNSRNFAIKLSCLLPEQEIQYRRFFRKAIPAYAYALHNHLRSEKTRLALFDLDHEEEIISKIDISKHVPNQVAQLIFSKLHEMYKQQLIDGNQLIILNSEFQSFTEVCGACERIKNTPIPFSYSIFIKKFIFIYIMSLPFGYVFNLGYWVVPVVAIIFYVLASLELIAEEIEDPFSDDANDIPTGKIAGNIHKHVFEIL